ncbi:acyltransferase-domain-containing protein [Tilletiaria anomala UBC 951]|uniref:Acyltransferase-domain-containing protein n=1 Tax=Tilletiaria anomala (strain ATCC 24038 / CBS 436.72 / UBC 951) TaxID=1037660 RepID=A0A066VSI1_TILAU|nr:acyltransferase-domain-containing protein [Tilletiaria anomala UBC 951]KDN41525.1 acyltransferase-domain-containing protein [Tilletiaria anomala UBC 951]
MKRASVGRGDAASAALSSPSSASSCSLLEPSVLDSASTSQSGAPIRQRTLDLIDHIDVNSPDVRGSIDGSEGEQNDLNVVAAYKAHFREDPVAFLQQVWAYGQGEGWRGYTDYIGTPILYPSSSTEAIHGVLTSEAVRMRIQVLVSKRLDRLLPDSHAPADDKERKQYFVFRERRRREMEAQLTDVAAAMMEKSAARLDSLPFLKVFAASVNNILARMYNQGIHISAPEVMNLRRAAAHAAEKKQSLIFLPAHKSHIDYLTVSWLMFRLGIALPHIVAGENLDIPVVGQILRRGGAFFIRRQFKGDELYPIVIREYIEQLLAAGKNIECFIEGTRSRTGKLLPPKLGILKYIVDGLMDGRTNDVWICPISLQYDSVIESETYVSELLGKPKESETLLGLLSGSSSLLQLKMGRIDIRFQQPWSLKGFMEEQRERRDIAQHPGSPAIPFDAKNRPQHKLILLKALGYRILADINSASVVMPAALVGTVILTLRGRGVGRRELIRRVEWLRSAILAKGYRVADFGQMSIGEVVDRTLGLMKDLIFEHKDVMEPTFEPIRRFELSFYRNQVMHVFVSESLASATLYTAVKQGGAAPNQRLTRGQFDSEVAFLSMVLKNEFVYGTESLGDNVDKTIQTLVQDRVFKRFEDETIGLAPQERDIGRENFDTYLFMVWPFIEGYWLAACALVCLTPIPENAGAAGSTAWFASKDFEKRAQLFGKTLYQQGELSYLEAINVAVLQQAFGRYEELGMIIRKPSNAVKPIPLVALHPDWRPTWKEGQLQPTGKLWEHLERLGRFRREGKDRREQLVSRKILQHANGNAPPVVEWTKEQERWAEDRAHL